MRKLATIERIAAINPHPNADNLELATVRGWQVIVKKDEFQSGDLCVYCEIDSVLPEREEFEFLRERKFRVRTIKLRGELSQGICFPLSILLESTSWEAANDVDVTDELGITLYQQPIPACLGGDIEGAFPSFIPKTDCERIQNHSRLLQTPDVEWAATEKLDGSSCTIFWKEDKLHVCSRNWEVQEDDRNAYWQAARSAGLTEKLKGSPIALQGELLGPKIQGNRYGISQPTLYFFDAFDMERRRYLDFTDFQIVCERLGVESVPMVYFGLFIHGRPIKDILMDAEGKSALNQRVEREGLVWKPLIEATDPRMGRVAFKAISNKFLLKEKD